MRKIQNYQLQEKQEARHSRHRAQHSSYAYKPANSARRARPAAGGTSARGHRHQGAGEATEKQTIWSIAFFPLTFLYYELLMRLVLGEPLFKNFFYILFFRNLYIINSKCS